MMEVVKLRVRWRLRRLRPVQKAQVFNSMYVCEWAKQNSKLGTTCSSYLDCFLQLSKDEEEELSPHMFSYREVMAQISEREEKVVEQLKELRQVWGSSKPSPGCLFYVGSSLLCGQMPLGRQQCKMMYQWCYFFLTANFFLYFLPTG